MDGSVSLAVGTVDVGGSRASLSLVAAEELGIDYAQLKAVVADTSSLGYNDMQCSMKRVRSPGSMRD